MKWRRGLCPEVCGRVADLHEVPLQVLMDHLYEHVMNNTEVSMFFEEQVCVALRCLVCDAEDLSSDKRGGRGIQAYRGQQHASGSSFQGILGVDGSEISPRQQHFLFFR